jgi:exosortase/archaeosortase family protein
MMMLFFAICVAAAFLATHKPLWERLLIVASAPPIAVLSNVLRIVVTAAVYDIVGRWSSTIDVDRVEQIIHDWAGFLMMPVGLLLLWAEMSLLSKLLIAPPPARPLMIGEVLAGQSTEVATERVLEGRQR